MTPLFEIVLAIAGIIIPSAILAWAVNRWLAPVSPRLTALLLALVLVTLHLGVFSTSVPVPLDEVMRGYPYKGIVGDVEAKNPVANDVAKQMLPWMQVAREEILSGRAPLWNPWSFSGYPLLGNAQSAALSPFFLATLFVPLPKQIVAMAGLKLFVALLFGVIFLREEGAGSAAALAGSMAYAFSIIVNVYLYYPHSSVAALLPALAWAVVRSMRTGEMASLIALSVITAATFASGHPETVLHLAIAAAVVMVIETVTRGASRGRAGLTIGFALCGALLAAAAWLPAAEQIPLSQRVDALSEGVVESPSFPAISLWAAIHPDGFGNPARGTWRWMFNYPMVASTFVGLIPLMLLPGGLLSATSRIRTRLYALSAIVAFLISMRWTVLGDLFNALPLASWTANDRLRFVVVFFVSVVVAKRLEAISKDGPSLFDLSSGALVLVLSIYVNRKLVHETVEPVHALLIGMLALFVAACLAAALSIWRNWRLEGAAGLPILAAVVIGIELFTLNLPYNALVPRSYFAPETPILEAVRASAPEEPWRLAGADWMFLPNASAQHGFEDVRGSDPMAFAPYARFFERIQVEGQALDVLRLKNVDDTALDFLNVRFLLAEPGFGAGDGWRKIYSGPDGELFENEEALRRFFSPSRLLPASGHDPREIADLRAAVVVSDDSLSSPVGNPAAAGMWMQQMSPTSFRLTVDSPTRTFVASSQPALPGWKIEVNGEAVDLRLVNGAFIGFWVPAGTSKVRVTYEPLGWKVGVALSVVSLLVLIGIGRRRSVRSAAVSGEGEPIT